MRLINTTTLKVHEFPGDSTDSYAILSHTWDEEECTLQDMPTLNLEFRQQRSYAKIKSCCEQAVKDGLSWAWVDTCCIDKTSTTELSEAINSMFRWYSNAKVCYAYLADVTGKAEFASSRWFTRGWTLQELIAPRVIQFYTSDWTLLGSKSSLGNMIQKITGIDESVLATGNCSQACVAKRMSWAAGRNTTRVEDQAYSLMGIFDVNMPLVYGEGKKAFLRLQQEIMRVSDDQSLFAWGAPQIFPDMHGFLMSQAQQPHSLFADSPADFYTTHDLLEVSSKEDSPPPVIHGNGVRVQYPVCTRGEYEFIILACTTRHTAQAYLAVPVECWDSQFYARRGQLAVIFPEHWTKARAKVLVVKEPVTIPPLLLDSFQLVRVPNATRPRKQDQFILDEVYCLPQATYKPMTHSISFPPQKWGPQAVLFFTSSLVLEKKIQSKHGIFPVRSFAIILGGSNSPWAVFVPILRDGCADTDFYNMLHANAESVRFCMKKSQLKHSLLQPDLARQMLYRRRYRGWFDEILSAWVEPRYGGPLKHRNLEISVDLNVEQINLVEKTIFVSIDIYEIMVGQGGKKPNFVHSNNLLHGELISTERRSQNYHPDWLTLDQLEWFIDRVP